MLVMEDTARLHEKVLSNGDTYNGNFKGELPHGKGKYTWSDGTYYEGDWEEGKMMGKGQLVWPSGKRYEGDVSGDYLHGYGTFIGVDGLVYRGAWKMGAMHGIGRKEYCNFDVYEGMWKEGIPEGSGRYTWNNGNTYTGNWKRGKMSGRGVMKWVNGDIYDGFWLNGLRQGSGIYKFADISYYFGTWSRGLKDGKGTFYPIGSKHLPLKKLSTLGKEDCEKSLLSHSVSLTSEDSKDLRSSIHRCVSEKVSVGGSSRSFSRISHRATSVDQNWRTLDIDKGLASDEESCIVPDVPLEDQHEMGDDSTVVYEREYMQGVLIKEKIRKNSKPSAKTKQKNKFPAKEVTPRSCMNIPIRCRSYYLMLNLQLGIRRILLDQVGRYTVGKITPVPMRDVRSSDFGERARIRMFFPRKGSQFTPPHYSVDFYWKDYCPMVFRNLRDLFKLDAAEYMMSICGDDGLRELSSPGKSGSIFYLSHDDRFFIKTLKKSELKVFLRMLPNYYYHVKEHENTLITKFFGLHRIKLRRGRKVRFVVMGNMFCTELRIHRRYDLKGSTVGRCTSREKISQNTTLKDLDLSYEFQMDKLLRESLFHQLALDCKFLESQGIIDYSLLLGLHFRAPEHLKPLLDTPDAIHTQESSSIDGANQQGEPVIPPKGLILVTHEPSSVSTMPGPHIRGSTLRAYSVGQKEVDLLLPGTARLRVQLGVNMPAQANRKLMLDEANSTEVELFEVYDVVLYMGIIDILQGYNLKKKAEHAYKSFHFDPLQISVVEPKLYAKRFIDFMDKVFPTDH